MLRATSWEGSQLSEKMQSDKQEDVQIEPRRWEDGRTRRGKVCTTDDEQLKSYPTTPASISPRSVMSHIENARVGSAWHAAVDRQRGARVRMASTWKTKYGMRSVRVDPPTLEEALYAAEGMTPDIQEQVHIAAELMHLPVDKVQAEAQRVNRQPASTARSLHHRGHRSSVIVERRPSRRIASRPIGRSSSR